MGVNTAKTFEQNSRQLTAAAKDAAAQFKRQCVHQQHSSTDYSTTTTKKQ